MESIEMEFAIPGIDGKPGLKLLGRNLKEALTIALDNDTLLTELAFHDLNLSGFIAMGGGFQRTSWLRTFLGGAVMMGCHFNKSCWRNVAALGCSFAGSQFYAAKLEDVDFAGSIFVGADFSSAYFKDVDFRGCDLSGVRRDALTKFIDCDFSGAKLRGTDIEYT